MGNYNPRSWFNVREFVGCALQVTFLVGAFLSVIFAFLYLILRR